MKQLHIISCVEDIPRFVWETIVQLYNLRQFGFSDKCRIIVFLPAYKEPIGFSKQWDTVVEMFPEAKFYFYRDYKASVTDLMINCNYHPIHRLCSLERHFKEHPSLEKDAILYIDSDVIFTRQPDIEQYIQDDVNYLSDTHTYLNATYLEGKIEDVIPEKKEEYKAKNPFEQVAKICNIFPATIRENNNNTGGAQYLLKNLTPKFFSMCIDVCLLFRVYYQRINQEYFPGNSPREREDKGIQSWCADMIAIQWELWKQNMPSQTPKWMDFAWATDSIDRLDDVFMLHNAGVTSSGSIRITSSLKTIKGEDGLPTIIEAPAFLKEKYKTLNVFDYIPDIEKIVSNPDSQKYCTSYYAQEILNAYNSLIKTKENE